MPVFVYYDCKPETVRVFQTLDEAKAHAAHRWSGSDEIDPFDWKFQAPDLWLYNGGVGSVIEMKATVDNDGRLRFTSCCSSDSIQTCE